MFGVFVYDLLFFAIPTVLMVLLGISIHRYRAAKEQNEQVPGSYSPEEIRNRKIFLIIMSVVAGILAAVVIGLIALLFLAVAFM